MNRIYPILLLSVILTACSATIQPLVVLTTNDTHSQIVPDDNGQSGYARRLGIIDTIRAHNKNVILVDDGDFSQGTILFNFFRGDVEVAGMSAMRYDAVTLGNHEFDNGVDSLAKHLAKATFPVVCANYDVRGTALEPFVKPYVIVNRGSLKIGIFGLGISPVNLIDEDHFKGITWLEPEKTANEIARKLKKEEHCDVVICISHLGVAPKAPHTDWTVAKVSKDIDLICGGHSHQMMDSTVVNAVGESIKVVQSGSTGAFLGRVDLKVKQRK
jgi:5'-nucleotidase